MPKGRTVTVRYYSEVFKNKQKKKEKKKKRKKKRRTEIVAFPASPEKNHILLHDNGPSHNASSTIELINSFK